MPHPLTLPALSVLAVVGSGVGVFLGRSAVAEINPAYFSEAQARFHSDLGPYRPSMDAARPTQAGALGAAELGQALGTGCVRCRAYLAEYYPVHQTNEGAYRQGYAVMDTAPVTPAAAEVEFATEAELAERAREAQEHAAALVQVHRYSTFEIANSPAGDAPTVESQAAEAEPTQLAAADASFEE